MSSASVPFSPEPTSTTTPTFTLFPKLPPELRLKICKLALPNSRVIMIRKPYCKLKAQHPHHHCRDKSLAPPHLLHVNRECREVALKYYNLAFADYLHNPVYFDFSRDFLCFEDSIVTCLFTCIDVWIDIWKPKSTIQPPRSGPIECSKVRNLALLGRNYQLDGRDRGKYHGDLYNFCNLKTLFLSKSIKSWETKVENILRNEWKEGREQNQQECKFMWKPKKEMRALFFYKVRAHKKVWRQPSLIKSWLRKVRTIEYSQTIFNSDIVC
jgi:hypothetical protein